MATALFRSLGRISYNSALSLQLELINQYRYSGETGIVLLCEHHPPVYTLGLRQKKEIDEKFEQLKKLGADVIKTQRGGLTTFHNLGQLVCYPILNLRKIKMGPRDYVHSLEQAVIRTCQEFNINAHTTENVGVWIGDEKVCAIGVQISYGLTYHGLAINCCNDLSWFEHIVPCGIEGKTVTSLTKLCNQHISVDEVAPVLIRSLENELKISITQQK